MLKSFWGRIRSWQLVLALLALVAMAVAGLALWELPQWQVPPEVTDPRVRAELENQFRTTLAQIALGLVVLIGAYLTLRRVRATEQQVRAAEQTVEISREQQITERFTRAIEQLGSDKLAIRLGGIYALERIARDSPDKDHWQVMEVLTSYVRENARRVEPSEEDNEKSERQISTDIQAILTVLGRRDSRYERPEQQLSLRGANLRGADLSGANNDANWARINLFGADLAKANLAKANLAEAVLRDADLSGACMFDTNFTKANFIDANLGGANLSNANLTEAILWSANLAGAGLSDARELTQGQVDSAIIDKHTTLPDYLR